MWATVDPRLMAQPTSLFLLPAPHNPALLPRLMVPSPRPASAPSPDSASLELQSLALASHAYSSLLVVLKFLIPYVYCLWVESPANFLEVHAEI